MAPRVAVSPRPLPLPEPQNLPRVREQQWTDHDGQLHRDNSPAIMRFDRIGNPTFQAWYQHGLLHREDQPAEMARNYENQTFILKWYVQGNLHRDNGPAVVVITSATNPFRTIEEQWFQHGQLHRTNGPAVTRINIGERFIDKEWHLRGQFVRRESNGVV